MNANGTGTTSNALASMNSSDTSSGLSSLSNRFALDVQGFDACARRPTRSPQRV